MRLLKASWRCAAAAASMLACGPAVASLPMTQTCAFKSGPRAGQAQQYSFAQPIPVGSPCHDGQGSIGVAVPDTGTGKIPVARETTNFCRFTAGPRNGQVQAYLDLPAIPVDSPCQDGLGSTGVAVSRKSLGAQVTASNTCRFTNGPRAGQVQNYPSAAPIPVGAACHDGAGSTGFAVSDGQGAGSMKLTTTCRFTGGPRAGQLQSYPSAAPIPVGTACHDGVGSVGVAVEK